MLDLGPHEPELAGIFTGTYIGGSLNFAAVAEASGMQDGSTLGCGTGCGQRRDQPAFPVDHFYSGYCLVRETLSNPPYGYCDASWMMRPAGNVHQVANLDIAGLLAVVCPGIHAGSHRQTAGHTGRRATVFDYGNNGPDHPDCDPVARIRRKNFPVIARPAT